MNRHALKAAVILIVAATAGCAGQQAQTLAANLGRLTHEYDAARGTKAQAETAYYAEQLRILRGALGGSFVVPKDDQATIDKGVPVKYTVAYLRIVTSARRDAYLLAEALGTPGAEIQAASGLLRFLDQGLRDDREVYLDSQHRQQQLRTDLLANLERIDRQEGRLATIMRELRMLEEPASLKVTVEQLYAIGQAIQKQLMQTDGAAK